MDTIQKGHVNAASNGCDLVIVERRIDVSAEHADNLLNSSSCTVRRTANFTAFAASFVAAAVAALCGVYMAGIRIAEAVQGRVIVADGPEAEH